MTHYVAMAGLHGCIPNVCEAHDSLTGAVDSMASLHELGRKRRQALKRDMGLELDVHRDGNEYIEISECSCDNPDSHNDI